MDGLAMTSMNARIELTSVTQMHNVQTLRAPMNAPAILGLAVMVKGAKILTNACMDHITAVRMRLVRTLWAHIHVRAKTVSMLMVVLALTSMSAEREVIFVMIMPTVLTIPALTAASAEKATLDMDD